MALFFMLVKGDTAFVVNTDYTGIRPVPSIKYTYDPVGTCHGKIQGHDDKRQCNVAVSSFVDNEMLPL